MTPPLWWQRLARLGRGCEDALLGLSLILMVGLAVAQIVMRNIGIGGFVWGDELLRLLVLWLALIGAVAASRDDHHISIDVLSRFLPPRVKFAVRSVVDVFTSGVCAIIAWYAVSFVASTREFEEQALGSLPLWYFQLILPVGFGLISYRYALWAVRHALVVVRDETPAP